MKEYKPRSPLSQQEAMNTITRREMRVARERFGVSLLSDWDKDDKFEDCLWAMIWVFEVRDNPDFTTDRLDDFELGDASNYFTPEDVGGEPTEAGKAPSTKPATKRSGAS